MYVPVAPGILQKLAFHITPGAQRVSKDHPTHGSKQYDGCSLASGIDADCGGLADYLLRNSIYVIVLWINRLTQTTDRNHHVLYQEDRPR